MRAAASVLVGLVVTLSLAGCAFIVPQQTTISYQPSDGVDGQVGAVDIRNAMLISTNGTDANLVVNLINTASSSRTVEVQYSADGTPTSQTIQVPSNSTIQVSPEQATVITLNSIKAPLGSLFGVTFIVGSATPHELQVPVLGTGLPGYSTLAPTPTPTPTDGGTPDPSDSATPATN